MLEAEEAEDFDEAEIVCEGRECWLGLGKISRKTVYQLLQLCLISDSGEKGKGVERYVLNEEGRAMARDPLYVPKIVAILAAEADGSPTEE